MGKNTKIYQAKIKLNKTFKLLIISNLRLILSEIKLRRALYKH